ncbi:MAG: hypothetical protein IKX18_03040 [Muribaculaceae bacterium]|nr:hypothetical protein [Muribaculaceae bacterium]
MMTLIAFTVLLTSALLDLFGMLLPETYALQQNGRSNNRYYSWLVKGDELTAPRRLIVLAVLICCCTTMARSSWMVILLLGATLLAQGITLLLGSRNKSSQIEKRSWLVYITAIIIALLGTSAAFILGRRLSTADGVQAAATTAVILLALSPLVAMLANWLLSPLKNHQKSEQN